MTLAGSPDQTISSSARLDETRAGLRLAGFPVHRSADLIWARSGRHDVALLEDPFRGPIFVKRRGVRLSTGGNLPDLGAETLACQVLGRDDAIGPAIPELLFATPDRQVFVARGYPEHRTMSELIADGAFFDQVDPVSLGRLISGIHAVPEPERQGFQPRGVQICTHGSVSPADLVARPGAYAEYLRRVQPRMSGQLRKLRERWRPTAFVHGDLTAHNILVASSSVTTPPIVVTDWELAGVGDPAGDLGALLGSVLWASLIAVDGGNRDGSGAVYQWLRKLVSAYLSSSRYRPDLAVVFQWAGHWIVERVLITLPPRGGLSSQGRQALLIAEELLEE